MELIVAAIEATVKLGLSVSVDGYMMPNGSFRYGLTYISELLGYAENYFLRLTKIPSKKLKALHEKGFTGYIISVRVARHGKRGASIAKTISFDDFCILIEHEAEQRNPKAIALLTASFRELLRSRSLDAFGLPEEDVKERQQAFETSYQSYLKREQLLEEEREELANLVLPGDENLDYDFLDNILYYPDFDRELEVC